MNSTKRKKKKLQIVIRHTVEIHLSTYNCNKNEIKPNANLKRKIKRKKNMLNIQNIQ